MRVVFTKHAEGKFDQPDIKSFQLSKKDVKNAIEDPDYSGVEIFREARFVLKKLDSQHSLRVIYKAEGSIITVITFYPTKKGRYEKKKK